MKEAIRKYLLTLWFDSAIQNNKTLAYYIEPTTKARVLEIGCYNGTLIVERVGNIEKPDIYGIDIDPDAVSASKRLGIKAVKGDVEDGLPFDSNFFDIVSANQIIEHLVNVDKFIKEIYRVLRPKGYLVLSTENLSSWHNIFALCLGWQAFSQHISTLRNVGNPLRLAKYEGYRPSGMHVKIFTPRGLRELFELYGFKIEKSYGAGYYPFPPLVSRLLSHIDPLHAPFIGFKARKRSVIPRQTPKRAAHL